MPDWQSIFAALREDGVSVTGNPRSVGGGDISAAWRIETREAPLFVKTGGSESFDMFEAEAEGLSELGGANAVRVPEVRGCGLAADGAYLAIEWIEFERPSGKTEQVFGQQLAEMHRHCKDKYGWHRDNTIGLTPQLNQWCDNWVEFFREHRLGFQLQLAETNGFSGELQAAGRKLNDNLEGLFHDYEPPVSLLHGDLWGGNWAATKGQPVIFDPAVYYGDRESDIAMTQLFGGFGRQFYAAYQQSWPMEAGYEDRLKLYQLYHVLNHLNLFGSAYIGRAMQLIRGLNSR
ncbi:MAG: fructosamine kinase family protein [Woeseiaceae bacterium]